MRFELDIEIGGSALADGDTGHLELARLLMETAARVEAGDAREVGDEFTLHDYNGNEVGTAALTPDWAKCDDVWVMTGTGEVRGVIKTVDYHTMPGFFTVWTAAAYTGELLPHVVVDHRGLAPHGQPLLGRWR